MHSGIVAVWDEDREYAQRLSEYMRRQGGLGADVVAFTDLTRLQTAVDTRQVAVMLVGETAENRLRLQDTPVLFLTERPGSPGNEECSEDPRSQTRVYVCKYQPARQLLRAVSEIQAAAARRASAAGPQNAGQPARIRGIYSPLGGCLKTSLGLVMGSLLAEEHRCLFVSLEAHAGFRTLFGRQYPVDLADLFAAVRQGGDMLGLLGDALQPFGKLQYIPPVIWPVDVREAEFSEVSEVLRRLAVSGRFDEIIVDVGQDLCKPENVLSLCDQIYQPCKEDVFSRAKLAEYDCYLQISGYEGLRQRIQSIPLSRLDPDRDAMSLDQWQRWEQMIPLVRQLLEETDHAAVGV